MSERIELSCLYTKHKTQKRKIWKDGRAVLLKQSCRLRLFEANPAAGNAGAAIDEVELNKSEMESVLHGSEVVTEKFLLSLQGPWTGRSTSQEKKPALVSKGMQKLLQSKYRKPPARMPPPPEEAKRRIQQQRNRFVSGKRRPLQPGELERRFYGDPQPQPAVQLQPPKPPPVSKPSFANADRFDPDEFYGEEEEDEEDERQQRCNGVAHHRSQTNTQCPTDPIRPPAPLPPSTQHTHTPLPPSTQPTPPPPTHATKQTLSKNDLLQLFGMPSNQTQPAPPSSTNPNSSSTNPNSFLDNLLQTESALDGNGSDHDPPQQSFLFNAIHSDQEDDTEEIPPTNEQGSEHGPQQFQLTLESDSSSSDEDLDQD